MTLSGLCRRYRHMYRGYLGTKEVCVHALVEHTNRMLINRVGVFAADAICQAIREEEKAAGWERLGYMDYPRFLSEAGICTLRAIDKARYTRGL